MNYTMNFKKLAVGCLLPLSLVTSVSNASVFIKGYGGNTLSTSNYQAYQTNITTLGVFDGQYRQKDITTDNLFTYGLGLGFDTQLQRKVKLGLELSLQQQAPKTKFDTHTPGIESAAGDAAWITQNITNTLKAASTLVLTVNNAFFIKFGPALLRQEIETEMFETDVPANVFKDDTEKNFPGISIGSGFIYKLTKNFGIFTEYNFSYYMIKDLSDFTVLEAAMTSGGATGPFVYENRKAKFIQSEFLLGFTYSFFNGDDTYKYKKSNIPHKCKYEK